VRMASSSYGPARLWTIFFFISLNGFGNAISLEEEVTLDVLVLIGGLLL